MLRVNMATYGGGGGVECGMYLPQVGMFHNDYPEPCCVIGY